MHNNILSYYITHCLNTAKLALNHNEVPVGCIVISNNLTDILENNILIETHNMTNRNKDPLAHAELLAVEIIKNKIENIYNSNNNGEIENNNNENNMNNNEIKNYNSTDNRLDIFINHTLSKIYPTNHTLDTIINYTFNNLIFIITCEPCIMCMHILNTYNIKYIYNCKNEIFGGNTIFKLNEMECFNYDKKKNNFKCVNEDDNNNYDNINKNKNFKYESINNCIDKLFNGKNYLYIQDDRAIEILQEFYKGENIRPPEEKRKIKK
ncbi:Cytidine and deoxycytidylate deaminase [Spraguea lophii 42_110]|uniref:Cytidine and deoxycytidylate deaminase n=1 Tax=Spraguea lophii (strain 42_110) TaxID=1358809 RepID=S7XM13_SPRLO|nr:Cytidine and deoxycytidylate deaminase [Spraguea lophii 42_110]